MNLFKYMLVFTLITHLSFCRSDSVNTSVMNKNIDEIRYLALGDSYTIGESVDSSLRWPIQLMDSLIKSGINISETKIIARTGWTTTELDRGIDADLPEGKFQLVSLLIGVNNQYRGLDSEDFRIELKELLNRAAEFADNNLNRLFVLSIPDWSVTPFAGSRDKKKISEEIDLFNRIIEEETKKMNIKYFYITDISRDAASDPSLLAEDKLHPSGKMYSLWVNRILEEVISLLQN